MLQIYVTWLCRVHHSNVSVGLSCYVDPGHTLHNSIETELKQLHAEPELECVF